ncbi:double-cubane-cluster-containing anaerobic reductase [Thiohalomonas denitrificans]|uniref:Benzoyl-CoA reductase/2-hydroxyglutaryl-CoA dehydratase subunit, BcrC/BadD/HgdB n=1 Tax=Thiohalomonas denitrificans TaxID=415747 RepID=A0A1G5PHV9_9GAMM|nr:double-cubane-cluster-containing anaerobic reductase [Thiohalomonas denitrificans]SCZ49105.1 Benzoyl-CoA reductase/2-hydroxyglutaryl-CoA dehydratase subunit, BcrC/BadD/HgdB [Thiohalomonas denitrificans]
MSAEAQAKQTEMARKQLSRESAQALNKIEKDFPDNPKAMDYFYELYRRIHCEGEVPHPGKRVIGTTCVQVPDELIYAAGAVPVRLCNGSHTHDQLGAEFMPAKSCSLVKATLGMLSSGLASWLDEGRDIVNVTTCDQKTKSGRLMEEAGYRVYHLELPPSKESEAARTYWQSNVNGFARELGSLTGHKITRNSLRDSIARVARAQQAFRRLHRLRMAPLAPILGKDVFLVTNAYFFDDIDAWTDAVEALNDEVEKRCEEGFAAAQRRAPRILFTGSPPIFPNLKLPTLIEQSGAVIVADETCSANRMLYDAVNVDEWQLYDMVDALADRALKPCTCPIFVSDEDRKRRLLELARTFAVDGVVYQAFSGCQVFEMEQRGISRFLADEGIPSLYVETDYSPDDIGQLSTRIEAFIESLKARRRRK